MSTLLAGIVTYYSISIGLAVLIFVFGRKTILEMTSHGTSMNLFLGLCFLLPILPLAVVWFSAGGNDNGNPKTTAMQLSLTFLLWVATLVLLILA